MTRISEAGCFGVIHRWSGEIAVTDNSLQLARVDFVVNAIRANLPAASIWHDKRYGASQIDTLTLVSTGGMYSVNAYDRTHVQFQARDDMLLHGNLGLAIHHVGHTRQTLTDSEIVDIVDQASRAFESVIADDPKTAAGFRRVTCLMEFNSSEANVDQHGQRLFEQIGDMLNWPVTYYRFVFREIYLPTIGPEIWNAVEDQAANPRYGTNRTAEFLFDMNVPLDQVVQQIRAIAPSADSLLAPGIRTTIAAIPEIQSL